MSGLPCEHGRPDWRMCPHCIGINIPIGTAATVQDCRTGLIAPLEDVICTLRAELAAARLTIEVDQTRLAEAGMRVGLYYGCDTPDAMADEIEALREANSWIPVSERLPMGGTSILLTAEGTRGAFAGYMSSDRIRGKVEQRFHYHLGALAYGVTHWRELPAPPEVPHG